MENGTKSSQARSFETSLVAAGRKAGVGGREGRGGGKRCKCAYVLKAATPSCPHIPHSRSAGLEALLKAVKWFILQATVAGASGAFQLCSHWFPYIPMLRCEVADSLSQEAEGRESISLFLEKGGRRTSGPPSLAWQARRLRKLSCGTLSLKRSAGAQPIWKGQGQHFCYQGRASCFSKCS